MEVKEIMWNEETAYTYLAERKGDGFNFSVRSLADCSDKELHQKAQQVMSRLTQDGEGLTKKEFWRFFKEATGEVNNELGINNGKHISFKQFSAGFDRAEANGDGVTSEKELTGFMHMLR